jgi:diguanylate cyclase (GGDEF)-like protein/PAS domain S-box-containing protein
VSVPGDAPGLTEIARRWASALTDTNGVPLPRDVLEGAALDLVRQVQAHTTGGKDAALERFAALYAAAPLGIALADPQGVIIETNPALCETLARRPDELRGRDIASLGATPHDVGVLQQTLAKLRELGLERQREPVTLEHGDDERGLPAQVTVSKLPGDDSGSTYPVLMVEDVSDLELLRDRMHTQLISDSVTGLLNLPGFTSRLETAVHSESRGQVALAHFDLDGFRVINEGLGASVGNEVLRTVARILNEVFTEPNPSVARLSADTFAVLLHGKVSAPDVIPLVEEALSALAEPVYYDGHGVGVSASVGIVVRPAAQGSAEDLVRAAEITLDRAKSAGKAQWMLYEPEPTAEQQRRFRLGAVIAGSLEKGEFELEYQPTIKLNGSNEIAVVNAGLRWNHPDEGKLPAEEIYPLSDATGMTLSLGRMLLTESLGAAAKWHREFGPSAPDLCLRLPARLAVDPDLVAIVRTELRRHELPARSVRLCADSASLLDPRGEVLDSLSVLSDLDLQIALAVTGAADLELIHAHKLPVGFVVLSGPLVDALGTEESDSTIRHLIALLDRTRDLGIRRIGAEGVRNERQARRLRELGVIAGRGPLFGESAGGDEIEELIRRHTA